MPILKTYDQQVRAEGPTEFRQVTANDYGAANAQAMSQLAGNVGQTVDVVTKQMEQQEISDLNARTAKAQADLSGELQQIISTTTPGDKKPFEAYDKKVQDTFAELGSKVESTGAKNFLAEHSSIIQGQLKKTSFSGQAELSGIKAVQDFNTTINSLSSASMSDPSSLSTNRALAAKGIDALVASGQLPASKGFELKAEAERTVTKSAIAGWIDLDPEYAKEKIKSGEFSQVLGADAERQMLAQADQGIRAKEVEIERQRKEQERVKGEQQKVTQNKFLQKLTDGALSTKDIMGSNLEPFGSGSKETFIQLAKTRNSPEEKLKDNATTVRDLFERIHLPEDDPRKIRDENELLPMFGKGLSMNTLNQLRDEMQGKGTIQGETESKMKAAFFKTASAQLIKTNSFGMSDPKGEENYAAFQAWALNSFNEGKKNGKSAKDMLDPTSKDYLGTNLVNYKKDNKQIMKERMNEMKWRAPLNKSTLGSSDKLLESTTGQAPAAPVMKRNPGESAVDYMKRKKGGA